jgi:integrase/recombinase XerC
LNVKGKKVRPYRDTRGPDRAAVKAILAAADTQSDPKKAARDGVLLRLLYVLGLRRFEAVGIDIRHVDLSSGSIWVKGKGMDDRTFMKSPKPVLSKLKQWISLHPGAHSHAPVFVALDRSTGKTIKRLSERSVARILKKACKAACVQNYSPHALRHAAVTHALDATNGDIRRVRAFSRHRKLETVGIYDDARKNGAFAVAELIAF